MSTVNDVTAILRASPYAWPVGVSPAPESTTAQLAVDTPATVASALDAFLHNWADKNPPPYGYPGTSYEWFRYSYFHDYVEYWEFNTSIALGQQVEVPAPHEQESKTVSEWYNAQDHGINRLGYRLYTPADPDSYAWHQKLFAAALVVPPEWTVGTDPMIYVLACREGYIQPNVAGFGAAYASQTPRYADVQGLTAQRWLDNLRATDHGQPWPWLPTAPAHPVPA